MKIKTGVIPAITAVLLAAIPTVSNAQTAGFQIGIAQPTIAFAPTQIPAIATRGTFVAYPGGPPVPTIVVIQNQFVTPNPVFISTQVFSPNPVFIPNPGFTTGPVFTQNPVFIQNPVFAPNPVFIPNQSAFPNQVFVPGQTVFPAPAPVLVIAPPHSHFGPSVRGERHTPPAPGASRADVLQQFGQPTVTVTTSTGETLFFNGGITVTLQNGQVTRPR